MLTSNFGSTVLLFGAIAVGCAIGLAVEEAAVVAAPWIDVAILVLVTVLLWEVPLTSLSEVRRAPRLLAIAWFANFIVVPTVGFGIAASFLSGTPLLFAGVLIYFFAPCTDWFLGFTRLAGGDTRVGAALLPINMITQLVLFPVVIGLVAPSTATLDPVSVSFTMLQWFMLPLAIAVAGRLGTRLLLGPRLVSRVNRFVGSVIAVVIALVIALISTTHVGTILANASSFAVILLAVVVFFVTTFLIAEVASRAFRLTYPEHALLTMTTAARNAPLMLALTVVAVPDEPLIYAAIVTGMLIEFPHLTAIKHILLARRSRQLAGGDTTGQDAAGLDSRVR